MGSLGTTYRIPRPSQASTETCFLIKTLIDTGTAPTVCRLASTSLSLQAMQREKLSLELRHGRC